LDVVFASINPIARHAYMIYRLAVKTGQPQICAAKLSGISNSKRDYLSLRQES